MFHEKQWSSRFPKIMFHIVRGVINWLPLACILVSVVAVFGYHQLLDDALTIAQAQAVAEEDNGTLSKAFLFEMSEWNSGLREHGLPNTTC